MKIMVSSVGSSSGKVVVERLKELGYRVIGCNCYLREITPNTERLDAFFQTPMTRNAEEYFCRVSNICQSEGVTHIIPLTDMDVDFYSNNRKFFQENGIIICISDSASIEICRNKELVDRVLGKKAGYSTIRAYSRDEYERNIFFPAICKPKRGRSSHGICKLYEKRDWEYYKEMVDERYMIQRLIEGDVFCVDICRQPKWNQTVVIPRREILRSEKGEGVSVSIAANESIEKAAKDVAELLNVRGCINLEFIVDNEKKIYLMDCNPRFSGGLEFSVLAGYDMVKNHLRCFSDEAIDEFACNDNIYMTKSFSATISKIC